MIHECWEFVAAVVIEQQRSRYMQARVAIQACAIEIFPSPTSLPVQFPSLGLRNRDGVLVACYSITVNTRPSSAPPLTSAESASPGYAFGLASFAWR